MTSPNTFNKKLNAQYNLHCKAILKPERNDKAIIIKHLQINNNYDFHEKLFLGF